MPAYSITGYPASGRTSIASELERRGYTAYDTDELPGVTYHAHKDGSRVDLSLGHIADKSGLDWLWDSAKLAEHLESADTVFICAVTSEQHEFYDRYNKIFVLTIDEVTLKHRLTTRTSNDFGKHSNELKIVLVGRDSFVQQMLAAGAILVDATKPLTRVAGDILINV